MSNEPSFDNFLSIILKLEKGSTIKVADKDCRAIFMASYVTEKFPDGKWL